MTTRDFLQPGHNVWCQTKAQHAAFLIDAAAYFKVFCDIARLARHSIYVVGWDIDSRTELVPGDAEKPATRLAPFLSELAARRRDLDIYLLGWDYAFLYTFERERWPTVSFGLRAHHRVHFRLDGVHPMGASHHQKLIVVDDALAMLGGIDLSLQRYDTSAHVPHSPLRRDAHGGSYPPFHDIGLLVDGAAAKTLGELCRERWRTATREELHAPTSRQLWPADVQVDLTDVDIGVARTRFPTQRQPQGLHEVEALLLDGIREAKHAIYIEHQYVTSDVIGQALVESLHEPRGPEVIIIGPLHCSGWLEENTMGQLRMEIFNALHRADTHQRLRILAPLASDGSAINVHSKLLIVDDAVCIMGSANLSNRSMRLDTECEVALVAGTRNDIAHGIAKLRTRLMAEHLGARPHEVDLALAEHGSLAKTIDALNHRTRGLAPIVSSDEPSYDVQSDKDLIDPKEPLELAYVLDRLIPASFKSSRNQPLMRIAIALICLLALAALMRFTPLAQLIPIAELHERAEVYRYSLLALPVTILVFVLGNLALLPLTLLVVECGVIFGPVLGTLYAFIAALTSAAIVFWIGRATGQDVLQRFAQERLPALVRPLGRRSFFVVAAIRMLPGAPFTIVNLVFGASRIQFKHFFLGSVIGMAPGLVTLTVFGGQLGQLIRAPSISSAAIAIAIVAAVVVFGRFLKRRFLSYSEPAIPEGAAE